MLHAPTALSHARQVVVPGTQGPTVVEREWEFLFGSGVRSRAVVQDGFARADLSGHGPQHPRLRGDRVSVGLGRAAR